jgi:arylsulfatase A-like enzyme
MTPNGERRALADGIAWLGVAIANAPFVAFLSAAASIAERAGHHLVDLGHFAILAAVATALRALAESVTAFLRRGIVVQAALGALCTTPIFAWAFREDLAGFLERNQVPEWLPARALVGCAFACAYVGLSIGLERISNRLPTGANGVGVGLLVVLGNLALPPDYPGIHFFALAVAARLGSVDVSRALDRLSLSRGARLASFGALGGAALASLLVRPPASVWRRVFDVPCSVAPHLLGSILSPSRRVRASWIPPESKDWFRDRSGLPTRSPFPRSIVPKNAIVVLVTIDALRADVALRGEHDAALPALARVRQRAIRFVDARSPSPSTLTTAMALFTGKYYSQTYWTRAGNSVMPTDDESTRWPSLLSDHGVRTVHAIALRGLSKKSGVGRGFDRERQTKKDYGRASDLMNIVLDEVKRFGDQPGFVYGHFVDPHAPYNLTGTEGSPFERYLGEVALVDRELGRLLELVSRPDLAQRVVLVVSADHGEAFGEHGMNFHARSVYEELLRVPLFVVLPGGAPRDVTERVSLIDLGPTFLDLFGVGAPGDFMGESLVPFLAGGSTKLTRPLAADSGRRIQALLFPDGVKVIRDLPHRTIEVYDLKRDPGELDNLMDGSDFPAERYVAALDAFFEIHTLSRGNWEPPWRKF